MNDRAIRGAALAMLVLVLGCSKDETAPSPGPALDYRFQWVGDYLVERTCNSWDINGNNNTTVVWDTISVTVICGTADSIMVDQARLPVDSSGYYYSNPFPSTWYELQFRPDSISVRWASGGLGGGTNCNSIGARI